MGRCRRPLACAAVGALALFAAPLAASAHGVASGGVTPGTLATAWTFDPFVIAPVLISGWLYARGVRALWARAGVGGGVARWQAAAFGGGLLTLLGALMSPLDALSLELFSAHMTQHMLLILVAAPLLVLGAPLVAFVWALPSRWRRVVRTLQRGPAVAPAWRAVTHPAAAWSIYALAFWAWHAPFLFDAAVRHDAVHAAEHVTFVAAALLFWWTLIHSAGRNRLPHPAAIAFVFTTMLQQSALAALLTFSSVRWYGVYADASTTWHISVLQDQRLAGLIMWMPSNLLYLLVVGWLILRWLAEDERGVSTRQVETLKEVRDKPDVAGSAAARQAS